MNIHSINNSYSNQNYSCKPVFGRILVNNVPKQINKSKRVVILSGPSGVGKDTVLAEFINYMNKQKCKLPFVKKVVTDTTRAPRPGEVDGVNYNYKTLCEFKKGINNGEYLEFAEVYKDTFYGSDIKAVNRALEETDNAVLVIDVEGAQNAKRVLKSKGYDVAAIFLEPESMELLESRLRGRGTETEEKIVERLGKANKEINIAHNCGIYDAFVQNTASGGAKENVRDFIDILI